MSSQLVTSSAWRGMLDSELFSRLGHCFRVKVFNRRVLAYLRGPVVYLASISRAALSRCRFKFVLLEPTLMKDLPRRS